MNIKTLTQITLLLFLVFYPVGIRAALLNFEPFTIQNYLYHLAWGCIYLSGLVIITTNFRNIFKKTILTWFLVSAFFSHVFIMGINPFLIIPYSGFIIFVLYYFFPWRSSSESNLNLKR